MIEEDVMKSDVSGSYISERKVDFIAQMCHHMHELLRMSKGENPILWEDKPEGHRAIVKDSVRKILEGKINSAEESHINFVKLKLADGWTYGDTYNASVKVSPRLKHFFLLSNEDQLKEYSFFSIVKRLECLDM